MSDAHLEVTEDSRRSEVPGSATRWADGAVEGSTHEPDVAAGAATTPADMSIQVDGRDGAYIVRDFLNRNSEPFTSVDADGPVQVSVLGGPTLTSPSLRVLATAIGCHTEPRHDGYDLVIVGAGPAGLAAAVNGAAEGLSTLAIEEVAPGGQAGTSSLIENYPGFPDGVSGNELADLTHRQALRLGAEVVLARSVTDGGAAPGQGRYVRLEDGRDVAAGAVVVCTGVDWRRLNVPGVDRLDQHGVFYGAATSEAPHVHGQNVIIVGGGNSAGQAAMFFSQWAANVTIVIRGAALSTTLSNYLLDRIELTANITVLAHHEVAKVHGETWVSSVELIDNRDQTVSEHPSHCLFLCIGGVPRTQWAVDSGIACDSGGYLLTGADLQAGADGSASQRTNSWSLQRPPDAMETSWPLMYAVGDVRHGSIKRITTAMGEGALVVKTVQDRLVVDRAAQSR